MTWHSSLLHLAEKKKSFCIFSALYTYFRALSAAHLRLVWPWPRAPELYAHGNHLTSTRRGGEAVRYSSSCRSGKRKGLGLAVPSLTWHSSSDDSAIGAIHRRESRAENGAA